MKLVRIEHWRCGEPDASTFVWVPDEWSDDDLAQAAERAQQAYIAFEEKLRDKPADVPDIGPHSIPNYSAHPDKMVREVEEEFAAKRAEYQAWKEEQDQKRRSFGWYMEQEGALPFWKVDDETVPSVDVDWGHRHSWNIDYDQTKMEDKVVPVPTTDHNW